MHRNRIVSIAAILLLFIAAGCGTTRLPQPEPPADLPVDYRAVYLIHGDGDYLYHDGEGNPRRADRRVLRKATAVAGQATRGEIFIFHQKPERRILWLFPRKDRVMLHYRNGRLINSRRYSPSETPLEREAELVAELRDSAAARKALLYFGHEIPHRERPGYHRSRSGARFGQALFAEGSSRIQKQWDLIVLSTCNNGSPRMASALAPTGDWLLASPQNLHLSHIDTEKLLLWEKDPDLAADSIAVSMAEETFHRLEREIQTVISLAVYPLGDPDRLETFARRTDASREADGKHGTAAGARSPGDPVDCAELPFFRDRYSRDIRLLYRPPMFGRTADRKHHSGWSCRP